MTIRPETPVSSVQEAVAGAACGFRRHTRLEAACRYILATDGKRLRPNIVLEAARQGPEPEGPVVSEAAGAVELLHLGSLAHDDVIDGASRRRGHETVRLRFGDPAAVLSGGWLFAHAVRLAARSGDAAVALLAESACRMCDGQALEIADAFRVDRSPARYFAAIEGKTAALFALAAQLGAHAAGASEDVVARLGSYGRELGVAFQLADDLLDLLPSAEASGKEPGTDLRRGIYTLPVLCALEESPDLGERLGGRLVGDELREVLAQVHVSGGPGTVAVECAKHARAAEAALNGLHDVRGLRAAAQWIVERCAAYSEEAAAARTEAPRGVRLEATLPSAHDAAANAVSARPPAPVAVRAEEDQIAAALGAEAPALTETLVALEERAWAALDTADRTLAGWLRDLMVAEGGRRYAVILLGATDACGNAPAGRLEKAAVAAMLLALLPATTSRVSDTTLNDNGERGGNTNAVLGVDIALSRALRAAVQTGPDAPLALAEATASCCEGQMTEFEGRERPERSPARRQQILADREGACAGFAARLGAEVAGAPRDIVLRLEAAGRDIGVAFAAADPRSGGRAHAALDAIETRARALERLASLSLSVRAAHPGGGTR